VCCIICWNSHLRFEAFTEGRSQDKAILLISSLCCSDRTSSPSSLGENRTKMISRNVLLSLSLKHPFQCADINLNWLTPVQSKLPLKLNHSNHRSNLISWCNCLLPLKGNGLIKINKNLHLRKMTAITTYHGKILGSCQSCQALSLIFLSEDVASFVFKTERWSVPYIFKPFLPWQWFPGDQDLLHRLGLL